MLIIMVVPSGVMSGNGTTVRVVDLNTNTIVGSPITVGTAPAGLAIRRMAHLCMSLIMLMVIPVTGTISIIRTSDNTVVDTITGFSGPFAIAITPDGKYAYVTNFGSNNFAPVWHNRSVVDLIAILLLQPLTVGIQPSGIAITPDGRFAYVS